MGKTSVHFLKQRLSNWEKYGCKPQKWRKHLYLSSNEVIKLSKVQMENLK
jgi:hypothetical protein